MNDEKMKNVVKKARQRSPSYPGVDLESAINLAKELYNEIGTHSENIDLILHTWGHKPKSGHGLVKLAALKKFGIIEDEGSKDKRRGSLTQLALTIILDEEKESSAYSQALKDAALSPTIHKELWGTYSGSMPSDTTLKIKLVKEYNFSERGVNEFLEQFRKTIEFAKVNISENIFNDEKKSTMDKLSHPEWFGKDKQVFAQDLPMISNTQEKSIINQTERKMIDFPIPLSLNSGFILRHQFPMSEEEWEHLMSLLKLYKQQLVQPKKDKDIVKTEAN